MENRDMNLFDFIRLCWRALKRGFGQFGVWMLQTIRLGLQYFWIVFPMMILGLLGGWMWSKPAFTLYEGNATVLYADGMRDVVKEGFIDFLTLPKEVKIEQYGLSEENIKDFDRLLFYNVIDCNADSVVDYVDKDRKIEYADTMNIVMHDRTHLVLRLNGSDDFKPFERAFVKFFNEQDYIIAADKRCKAIQRERLAYFTKEVARLDSFSTYDYFVRPRYLGVEKGNYIISEREQELYYEDMMIVLKNKNYVENQLLATPDIINFQTPFIPYSMPLAFKYLIGLVCGGVLGLLLALAVKYRAVVVAYLKEK
ncbi:MAG: hypothetical protein UH103_04405 [Paludibacteraceae bacterium]|nr:hypothetical protein [Paludibacteraceae bacterium]